MGPNRNGGPGPGGLGNRGICPTCGTPAYPGEMFCVACGGYQGWEITGSQAVLHPDPVMPGPGQQTPPQTPPPAAGERGAGPEDLRYSADRAGAWDQPAVGHGAERHLAVPVEPLVIRGEVLARPEPAPVAEPEFAEVPRLLLCPICRSGNPETRQYCQPCGDLLRPVPEPPEPTRWQRLRERHLERPDVWHFDRRWLTLLIALPLCFGVGTAAGGAVGAGEEAVPWVKDRFAGQSSVAADAVEASSAAKGFDAKAAADGVDNRAWAPAGRPEDAVGQTWTATFRHPFRLTTLSLISGVSPKPKEYLQTGRPTKVTVTATTADGRKVRKSLTLFDQPGPQRFPLGIDGVLSVEIRIDSVRSGLKPKAPIALAEVQFFTRRTT